MSFRNDLPGVFWVPNKLLRERLINGDDLSNISELALGEKLFATGGVSLYSGTSLISNPPDSIAAPLLREVRQVTAQTTVSFDDTNTAQLVIPPSELGYIVGGVLVAQLGGVNVTKWAGGTVPAPNFTGVPIVDRGYLRKLVTAQGGSISTITFDALASSSDQRYKGYRVVIPDGYGGAGAAQARVITDYEGATKVATVSPNWDVAPDNTTNFYLEPASADVQAWKSFPVATPNIAGIPKVEVAWWLGAAPAGLTANGFLQSALQRWLTDDAAGTPGALNSGAVRADFQRFLNVVPPTPSTPGVPIVDAQILLRGRNTAQGGAGTTITLDAGANGVSSSAYVGGRVIIVGGTGAGQEAIITAYDQTTKIASITPPWPITAPDNTSVFVIAAADGNVVAWKGNKVFSGVNGYPQVDARYWNSALINDAEPPSGTNLVQTLTGQTNAISVTGYTPAQIETYFAGIHGVGLWGGLNVVLAPGTVVVSNPTGSADFAVFNDSNWQQPITITGLNSTGWTKMVLTIKQDPNADGDDAALVTVRVSNPGAGGDGLLVLNGLPATDPTLASITVGTITPDTQVTWNLTAGAMDIPASERPPYAWELTRFKGAVKEVIASGKLIVRRSVRRALVAP